MIIMKNRYVRIQKVDSAVLATKALYSIPITNPVKIKMNVWSQNAILKGTWFCRFSYHVLIKI